MAVEENGRTRSMRGALADFIELIAKAVLGGVGVAVALAVAILALSGAAQAADTVGIEDARTGTLMLRTQMPGRFVAAPKVSTEVAIEVHGIIARTRVTQLFHNPGAEHVEGIYVFPLPEKGAVDRLRMRIGSRVIEGLIREKGEARREYEEAKREGRKAALVEQQRPNLFTNSVANIGPGDWIEVRIEYQQTVAFEDGEYRLRFPLAVTPRYQPAVDRDDPMPDEPKALEAADDAPVRHPHYARGDVAAPVNPVDIAVSIDAASAIGAMASTYHDAAIAKLASHRTLVHLVRDQVAADRDFELTWTLAAGAQPQAAMFVERGGAQDYALLMVVPPQPSAEEAAAFQRLPRETVFVIDTSGSMQGASIRQARLALEHGLDTLGERDRFNVIEFNSATRALYAAALPATPANLSHARDWVRSLEARGGTEMLPALALALDGRDAPGYLRQVIFMTDGAVGNEEALFRLIARRLGDSRLFTVGIGSAPNGHFMTKAAQFGRGTFTHIGDTREVREKMSKLFARLEAPVLRDVTVRWPDGSAVETFPPRVPDLYLGEPVVVAAAARAPLGTVVVSGLRGNRPWSVALTPGAESDANGVGALWARAKIAALMDDITRGADPARVRPRVVKVALEHRLVSAYTSLVAVELTPTAPPAGSAQALVKASLPSGFADGMQLPQTATGAMLQLLLGALALLAAALVAAVGGLGRVAA